MNINSQFCITNYTGKEPLDLMAKPASITGVAEIADYNRFIEAISTIYGNQNSTGNIPTFWTTRNSSSDSAGHIKYVYVPSAESSLKTLQSTEAYYFIIRDNSYLPLKIPTVSGTVPGFVDYDGTQQYSLPVIVNPSSIILGPNQGNVHTFSVSIDKLEPQETYKYEFKAVSSNWPTVINSISGIIKPSEPQTSIDATLTFCVSTGVCVSGSEGLIDYTLDNGQTGSAYNKSMYNLHTTIQLSVEPISYDGPEILGKQFTALCEDCLPELTVNVPTAPITLAGKNNYCQDIIATVSGLIPNHTYNYEFSSVIGNWPAVITPPTGTFKASKKTTEIRSRLAFCPSTILCTGGTPGLLDYDLNSYQYLFDNTCGKFVTLELSVNTEDETTQQGISDRLTIYCQDCLGDTMVPSLTISANPA